LPVRTCDSQKTIYYLIVEQKWYRD